MAHNVPMGHLTNPMDDEQKIEQEALAAIDESKIKAEIISELGLDEVDDAERIEKAVAREVKTRKFAASAIGTKVKLRQELDEFKKKNLPADPAKAPAFNEEELLTKAEARALAKFEEREFENLGLPDDLKETVKTVAKNTGKTYKQALEDPYIKFQLDQAEKEGKLIGASVSRIHKPTTTAGEPSIEERTKNIDMNTEEGRKQYVEELRKNPPKQYVQK